MKALNIIAIIIGLMGTATESHAQHGQHTRPYEMQHGFILSVNDAFASHLVANGHHSRQTDLIGQLLIEDQLDKETYETRKSQNGLGGSYFVFQAQGLDLLSVKAGQILVGHIIESKTGDYEPKNIIVKKASFTIQQVLLNIENPFFK